MKKNPIEAILAGKNAALWRQSWTTDGAFPAGAYELATDSYRAAIRKVESATEAPIILKTLNGATTVPNLRAVWPLLSSLPNRIDIQSEALPILEALAKTCEALAPKGKRARHAKTPCVEFRRENNASGFERAFVEIVNLPHSSIVASVRGITVSDNPIRFNLRYLLDVLPKNSTTVFYDNSTRPALIPSPNSAPTFESYHSIIMPVSA